MLKALPKFAVEHPMVMIPIYLAMIGIGIVLYFQTPLQLQPYVENPTVGIVISYPGVSAEDMEYYFARPIEKKMGVLGGVKFIRSNSQEGRTEIDIGFEYLSDMNQHKLDVQTLLTNMLNELPFDKDNTTNPWVVHVANDNVPILDLNVSHAEWDDVRLREFLDNIVRERFESVSGVQSIMPYGGKRRLMLVEVDRDRLAAYQLGLMDVKAAIEQQNLLGLALEPLQHRLFSQLSKSLQFLFSRRKTSRLQTMLDANKILFQGSCKVLDSNGLLRYWL
ncbi:MAG: efflux RND transporter permease subunit [candidate division NC10 bacterium]|nr:efflux RND transporter permease subunit [candidate division NC10 bacterium]